MKRLALLPLSLLFIPSQNLTAQEIRKVDNQIENLKRKPASFQRDTALINRFLYKSYSEAENDRKKSQSYIDSALKIAVSANHKSGIARVYHEKFRLNKTLGFWQDALQDYNMAITLFTEIGDNYGLLRTRSDYSNALWDLGRFDESINEAQKIIEQARLLKDLPTEAKGYHNLAYGFDGRNEHAKALLAARAYVRITHQISGNGHDIFPEETLIYFLLRDNRAKEAEMLIPSLISYLTIYGSKFERYYYPAQLAKAYTAKGDFFTAERFIKLAETNAKHIPSRAHKLNVAIVNYNLYYKWGKFDKAIEYLIAQNKLEKEIAFDRVNMKVNEVRHNQDMREQQAKNDRIIIQKQNQTQKILWIGITLLTIISGYAIWNAFKIKQKNKEISAALLRGQTTERKRVAAELHDNLGSSLSAIKWNLLSIDQQKLEKTERDIYANVVEMTSSAYENVRSLSHNMLPEELEKEGLHGAIYKLIKKLNLSGQIHFSYQNIGHPIQLNETQAFQLYNIVLELSNNILKHSGAKLAFIEIEQEVNKLCLRVWDNGNGFSDRSLEKGKGLSNIENRLNSLRGNLTYQSSAETGTKFEAEIPL